MMGRIQNQLKNFDFFRVTYSPAISDGLNYSHSSVLGGIISIIISILSLSYCIYYLYLWKDYHLLPKVTEDIYTFQEDTDFGYLTNKMKVTSYNNNGLSAANPFKNDAIIIMPLILDLDVGEFKSLISNITEQETLEISFQMGKDSQFIIIFTLCKEEYLLENQKCASKEVQDEYFNVGGNSLYSNIQFTTINPSTFETQTYERTYPIFVHTGAEICSSITLHYQLNHYLIDKAFLFSSGAEELNYISDSLNFPQYASKSFCDQFFLPDTFGAFWIVFQQQYRTIQIGYPQISEVFAAIGSILSILFSVKYVITLLNLTQLRKSVLDDIVEQYYPEIKQFKIAKNFWGKINCVKFRDVQVEIQSYLTFLKQIHLQLACKLNYKNLLYEMSRFQFILMQMKRRTEIEKVHNIGIKVPLQLSESGNQYVILTDSNQQKLVSMSPMQTMRSKQEILNMDDALILSMDFRKFKQTYQQNSEKAMQFQSENEEEEREPDYYDINFIQSQNRKLQNIQIHD